jgi:hypothetical protein
MGAGNHACEADPDGRLNGVLLLAPYRIEAGMAVANLFGGRFDEALWAARSFRSLPSFLMVVSIIAASHALAGWIDEAQRAM